MTEEELRQRETALEQREQVLRLRIVRAELSAQLAEAGCRPEAVPDAAALMAASVAAVELAEDGLSIARITIGKDELGAVAAARAFLRSRPHFTKRGASDGRAEEDEPAPTTPKVPEPASESSVFDEVQRGWKEPPR